MAGRGRDLRKRKQRPGKIRGSKAEPRVRACLLGGGSLREASSLFTGITGEKISLNAMSHHHHAIRMRARQVLEMETLAQKLAGQAGGADISALARRMLQAQALDAVAELDDFAFEGLPAERLSLVVARLERAAAVSEHARLRQAEVEERARRKLMEKLERGLRGRPEIWSQVCEALAAEGGGAAPEAPQPGALPRPPGAGGPDGQGEGGAPPAPPASPPAPGDEGAAR